MLSVVLYTVRLQYHKRSIGVSPRRRRYTLHELGEAMALLVSLYPKIMFITGFQWGVVLFPLFSCVGDGLVVSDVIDETCMPMRQGPYGVRLSVCLCVPTVDCCSNVRRICCCGPGGRDYRSIAARRGAQRPAQGQRSSTAVSCMQKLNKDIV